MAISTDTLIIGAGPCGLFQVFELGLLGLNAHLVEALPNVGGQCAELYPDKPIYDIPALPICGAQELVDRLMEQIAPFKPTFHLGQQVTSVTPKESGRFDVETSAGTKFDAGTVVIAAGAGAFEPVRLRVDGLDAYENESMWYRVDDPARFDGKRVVILGGGDSALDWTLSLVDRCADLELIHRSDRFRAVPATVAAMRSLCEQGRMRQSVGNIVAHEGTGDQIKSITTRNRDGDEAVHDLDQLLVFFGLSPKLGPIAQWGLALQKNSIEVDAERFETSIPGIYSVGDINVYPGKKKLILSGFHEAALAAFAIKKRLFPDEKLHLQYTTTSPIMHERLGVS